MYIAALMEKKIRQLKVIKNDKMTELGGRSSELFGPFPSYMFKGREDQIHCREPEDSFKDISFFQRHEDSMYQVVVKADYDMQQKS